MAGPPPETGQFVCRRDIVPAIYIAAGTDHHPDCDILKPGENRARDWHRDDLRRTLYGLQFILRIGGNRGAVGVPGQKEKVVHDGDR